VTAMVTVSQERLEALADLSEPLEMSRSGAI
jgi:hypothetical protein